jgi:hypothetical protein
MQEMRQDQAVFYLSLFDKLGRDNSLISLSNARDYIFLGEWRIPNNWQTLYLNNTPCSWGANHPTHILRKHPKDSFWADQRNAHEHAYANQINYWNNCILVNELQLHIAERDRICEELTSQLHQCRTNFANLDSSAFVKKTSKFKLIVRRVIEKFTSLIH